MNLLDKAISWVSPETGLQRARARMILGEVQKLGYDGAKPNRSGGWTRSGGSANAETSHGLKALRDGASEFVRNNALASSAMVQFQTKLVGTGIRPQADTGNPRWNALLNEAFEDWARATKYYGMQSVAARNIPERGECLLQFHQRAPLGMDSMPLSFELLEADHIDHLKSGRYGENRIIQGVEFAKDNREVAVWVYRAHPGDSMATDGRWFRSTQSERVLTTPRNPLEGLVRGYREDRPEQVRGVSWFAPVMIALWDLAGYEEAERIRKRIEACLAAFVTSPSDTAGDVPLGPQKVDDSGYLTEEFRPGAINRLRPGESVTIAEPKASGGYLDYTRRQDRLVAVGLGLLYELIAGDLSMINYSSYRGGLVGLRDWIEIIQWNVLIPFCCDPVWQRFVIAAKIAGIVPASASSRVKWTPPYFDFLDREAEAKADQMEMRNGTATWDQTIGRRGYDPDRQAAEIEARNQDWDRRGIILDCDPRNTASNGAARATAQPQPTQQEQPQ